MISIVQSLILGVVEGFTEFLPISSTAHLILASKFLWIAQSDYTKTFEIAIQSGAILAVVFLYWRSFFDWQILKRIIIAFVPTGFVGLVFYGFIKDHLLGNTGVVLWALGSGGLFLVIFEYLFRGGAGSEDMRTIGTKKLLGIGLFQSIAVIPGVSRAAATIVGGMILGIKRTAIVEFSFLLAVPTMIAAAGFDLFKNFHNFSSPQVSVLTLGFITSFIMAVIGIRFLLNYVKKHSFTGFGVYRIILVAVIVFLYTLRG